MDEYTGASRTEREKAMSEGAYELLALAARYWFVLLIALIGRLLIVPGRFFWRLLLSGVAGALILAAFNLLSPLTHLSVHVNPFTALAVGFLGIPGALLLIALNLFL